MKILLGVIVGWLVMGCGVKTNPISSIEKSLIKKDSVNTITKTKNDSSVYRETVTEKILPSSSVDLSLTVSQLDSVIRALKAMPIKTREIVRTDPRFHAILKFKLDSIGNVIISCTQAERAYFEKSVLDKQYQEKLVEKLNTTTKENTTLKETVKQLSKSTWQKFTNGFNRVLVKILIGFIAISMFFILIEIGFNKTKDFIKSKFKL